jgi:hypothetical protein
LGVFCAIANEEIATKAATRGIENRFIRCSPY